VTGDHPYEPRDVEHHDFDPFAGFTGGVEETVSGVFDSAPDIFDPSGLALQFGPPPLGRVDDHTDPSQSGLNWYDAPHHW
jgi:hypothetical protein